MEKTLTFTVEDALLSPTGFSILSGAGLFSNWYDQGTEDNLVHVHKTSYGVISLIDGTNYGIDLTDELEANDVIDGTNIFISLTDEDGSINGYYITSNSSGEDTDSTFSIVDNTKIKINNPASTSAHQAYGTEYEKSKSYKAGDSVFIDYYIMKSAENVEEMQIDADHFAGYYYVEAETLFRRQADGVDMPAILTFPNVKIQSNFTFTMAASGDPSTFTFTMDAFPGYTYFDKTKKVLCVLQVVTDSTESQSIGNTVMGHDEDVDDIDISQE